LHSGSGKKIANSDSAPTPNSTLIGIRSRSQTFRSRSGAKNSDSNHLCSDF